MGITICKKHGRLGFEQVCEHINAKFQEGIYPNTQRLNFWGNILVCPDCWKKFEIEKFENHPALNGKDFFDIEDEFDENSAIFKGYLEVQKKLNKNLSIWCLECIKEIKVKTARSNGESEPFPIFEKTLTFLQQDRVREIEKILTENLQFQKSIFWESQFQNRPALFVREGAFSYPLTFTIYYVVDEKEQNRIVEFIKTCLSQSELNQAKIIFYQAENWTSEENQFGLLNWRRGTEKVLKEVYLNC